MKKDELFGYLGIDTRYERELVYYKPILSFLKKPTVRSIPDKEAVLVERARMFSIYNTLSEYEHLISEIKEILAYIEEQEDVSYSKKLFEEKKWRAMTEILPYESKEEKIDEYSLLEKYSTLQLMVYTLEEKKNLILEDYSFKITSSQDTEEIGRKEELSIREWEAYISKRDELYDMMNGGINGVTDDEHTQNIEFTENSGEMYNEVAILEGEKNILHEHIGDISFIHRNYLAKMREPFNVIKILVLMEDSVIGENHPHVRNDLDELENKEEVLTLVHMDYFKKVNQYFDKKANYSSLAISLFDGLSKETRMTQSLMESTLEPAAETIMMLKSNNSQSLDQLVEIVAGQQVEVRSGYKKNIAEHFNHYMEEANNFLDLTYLNKEKDTSKKYYIEINKRI